MLLHDEVVDAWIELEQGRVQAWGMDEPGKGDLEGWIVPPLVNAHTHVADSFLLSKSKPRDVATLVGPGGWKHQQLAIADTGTQEDGVFSRTDEMGRIGTSHFIDFREGGVEGVRWLRGMADELRVAPVILGRQEPVGETDWDLLAQTADGIGLSGMRDLDNGTLDAATDAAKAHGKPFAIHVSEDKRDDLDAVLALEPDFVVHMCQGTGADFQALAEADIPVVICPRSNQFFGLKTPAKQLLEAGVVVAVGTDNGMLADGNLLQELALLQGEGIGEEDLLRMASHSGRYLLGLEAGLPPRRGAVLEALLLPHPAIPAAPARKPVFKQPKPSP